MVIITCEESQLVSINDRFHLLNIYLGHMWKLKEQSCVVGNLVFQGGTLVIFVNNKVCNLCFDLVLVKS